MPVERRTWTPTAPPAATPLATSNTPLAEAHSSAGGVPAVFEGLLAGLAAMEARIDALPTPTRVGTMGIEQLADDGRLVLDVRGLPVEQVRAVEVAVEPGTPPVPGSMLKPFEWAGSEGNLALRLTPSGPINQLSVGTFGQSRVRVQRDDYDSGWVDCAWRRILPIPLATAPLTLQVSGLQRWSGLSHLACELAIYSREALMTLGTLATGAWVEPAGLNQGSLVLEYSNGPADLCYPDPYAPAMETVVTLSVVGSNLELVHDETLPPGSVLWAVRDAWVFESYIGKVVMDGGIGLLDEAGGPDLWKTLDARLVTRGILSLGATAQTVVRTDIPADYSWRASCLWFCLRETEADYTISGLNEGRLSLWLNGSRVTITRAGEYTLRLRPGVNEIAFYGRSASSGNLAIGLGFSDVESFRATHFLKDWFAAAVPIGDRWPLTAYAQDAGLIRPHAARRGTRVRTSLYGQDAVTPFLLGLTSGGALSSLDHDSSAAAQALLRYPPVQRRFVRARLSGGPTTTPLLKIVRGGA